MAAEFWILNAMIAFALIMGAILAAVLYIG